MELYLQSIVFPGPVVVHGVAVVLEELEGREPFDAEPR